MPHGLKQKKVLIKVKGSIKDSLLAIPIAERLKRESLAATVHYEITKSGPEDALKCDYYIDKVYNSKEKAMEKDYDEIFILPPTNASRFPIEETIKKFQVICGIKTPKLDFSINKEYLKSLKEFYKNKTIEATNSAVIGIQIETQEEASYFTDNLKEEYIIIIIDSSSKIFEENKSNIIAHYNWISICLDQCNILVSSNCDTITLAKALGIPFIIKKEEDFIEGKIIKKIDNLICQN